jgi:hypothetical protein
VTAAGLRLRAGLIAALSVGTLIVGEARAAAQATPMPARPARFEVSGGGVFVGGYDLGTSVADLTPNSGTPNSFTLFTTDNKVRPVFGLQARVGVLLSPTIVVEGGLRFARPVYEVRASGDAESAPATTIEDTMSQYVFDGSLVWTLGHPDRRVSPFVFGGAGYLRELHEEDALVDDGVEYHAGAGVRWWFGAGARGFGLRAEGGLSIRDGGFDFEDGARLVPVASGMLVYRF